MDCEYCHKKFTTKYLLTQHQNKTRYCLELQGKNDTLHECEYCKKSLSTNERLITHLNTCKLKKQKELNDKDIYYQNIIAIKDNEIKELKAKLEKFENAVISVAEASKTPIFSDSDKEDEEDEEDENENLPLNVYQQLNQVANTIGNTKEEKEPLILSSLTINSITITSRCLDHYVNATELCQAGGKKFNHWYSLDTTKDLVKELSFDTGIPASKLVEVKRGGNNKRQGSWIHPDLAIQLAQWISPSFALQVSRWVRSLFNDGTVIIDLQLLKQQQEEMKAKDQRIKQLEDVCLTKRKRIEYPEQNVIYLLTTEDHLKRRTYIIGKAKNLTNRLSTYNKTCDHTVVHYRACKNEEDMSTAETMVISRLRDFKEQANRDRFVLPENRDISFFITTIDQCVEFLNIN